MERQEFYEVMKEKVSKKLGADYIVELKEVFKNNDVKKMGMSIRKPNETINPIVYIDEFYNGYFLKEGLKTIDDCVDDILSDLGNRENKTNQLKGINFKLLTNYNFTKNSIFIKACSPKFNSNSKLAIKNLDSYAASFYIDLDKLYGIGDDDGWKTIKITEEMLDTWSVSKEELFKKAISNTVKYRNPTLMNVVDVLNGNKNENLLNESEVYFDYDGFGLGLLVFSDATKPNGAENVFRYDLMRDIAKKSGESFYVIPSSVQELLLTPISTGMSPYACRQMVKEVNATVKKDEILGEEVLVFDREKEVLYNPEKEYSEKEMTELKKFQDDVCKLIAKVKDEIDMDER